MWRTVGVFRHKLRSVVLNDVNVGPVHQSVRIHHSHVVGPGQPMTDQSFLSLQIIKTQFKRDNNLEERYIG